MRNQSKATTLESRFPLLGVEENCIISKDADVTVCFKVRLPNVVLRLMYVLFVRRYSYF